MFYRWCFFSFLFSPRYLRFPSADRRETLSRHRKPLQYSCQTSCLQFRTNLQATCIQLQGFPKLRCNIICCFAVVLLCFILILSHACERFNFKNNRIHPNATAVDREQRLYVQTDRWSARYIAGLLQLRFCKLMLRFASENNQRNVAVCYVLVNVDKQTRGLFV